MTAQKKTAVTTGSVLGTALLALGTAFLLSKLLLLFTDLGTELIGALPALGMALLRACTRLT